MSETPTSAEVIEGAVELLETLGWIQHVYEDDRGLCMVQALRKSEAILDASPLAAVLARQAVWKGCEILESEPLNSVVAFNDADGRSKSDVILAMKHGASIAAEL